MPSLVSGYEYDIFISYRQKDNKGDHWVTEFVDALKNELESTFKEDISIYFDENPHDGLLETHHVGKSLENKLKCLIFIPIISQTYCDPRSFAWEHEFLAFNKMAKEDHFGRDIPLATGNVASRILPIKIHDLDADDKALFQSELGTVLRSVEFIYKSSGVNRPLKADDARIENANRTSYRDQINKVANAIKELMGSLKAVGSSAGARVNHGDVLPGHPLNIKEEEAHGNIRRLLVSTFRILKAGAETDFLAFSMPEAIAGSLSELKNLCIQMDLAGIFNGMTEKELEQLAHERKLEAAISGTVFQVGEEVRVTINLFQLPERSLLWTKSTQQRVENLFQLQDDIVQKILSSLKITLIPSEESAIEDSISKNPKAYPMFLKANQLAIQVSQWEAGRDLYFACLNEDPTFVPALARLARCYRLIGKFAQTQEETT